MRSPKKDVLQPLPVSTEFFLDPVAMKINENLLDIRMKLAYKRHHAQKNAINRVASLVHAVTK